MSNWPTAVLTELSAELRRAGTQAGAVFIELTEKFDIKLTDGSVSARAATEAGLCAGPGTAGLADFAYCEHPSYARLIALLQARDGSAAPPVSAGAPASTPLTPTPFGWSQGQVTAALADLQSAAEHAYETEPGLTDIDVYMRLRRRSWAVLDPAVATAAARRESRVLSVRAGAPGGLAGRASTALLDGDDSSWDPAEAGRAAARQIQHRRDSEAVALGSCPVVLGPGAGGVFLHEICGHGLEADCLAGGSVLAGQQGHAVSPAGVTVVDDPTLAGGWGSYPLDDEGTAPASTTLISDGIITGALSSRETCSWTSGQSTGHGRRQSFRHRPLPRASNTYLLPGPDAPGEIIADTRAGFFVQALSSGRMSPATGDFAFDVDAGFIIRDGKLAEPVAGVVVRGSCLKVLAGIECIGNDLRHQMGSCRKQNQHVPVSYGIPTVRVRGLEVGLPA
jgi:predicted Zn-dependent protease